MVSGKNKYNYQLIMKLLYKNGVSLFCNVAISSKLHPKMAFHCTEKNIYVNDQNFHEQPFFASFYRSDDCVCLEKIA